MQIAKGMQADLGPMLLPHAQRSIFAKCGSLSEKDMYIHWTTLPQSRDLFQHMVLSYGMVQIPLVSPGHYMLHRLKLSVHQGRDFVHISLYAGAHHCHRRLLNNAAKDQTTI